MFAAGIQMKIARLLSDVAEIGLHAPSAASFERELLVLLTKYLGADGGCTHVTNGRGRTTIEAIGHRKPKELPLVMSLSEIEADELLRRSVRETVRVHPNESRYDQLSWFHAYRRIQAISVIGRFVVADAFVMGLSLSRSLLSPFTERDAQTLEALFPIIKVVEELQHRRAGSSQANVETDFGLGSREAQITELVCKGLQNQEIAQLLGISRNTVRNNLANVFRKVGATTRSELVMICSGVEEWRGLTSLADGLKRLDNPARGFIETALGRTRSLHLPEPEELPDPPESRHKAPPAPLRARQRRHGLRRSPLSLTLRPRTGGGDRRSGVGEPGGVRRRR